MHAIGSHSLWREGEWWGSCNLCLHFLLHSLNKHLLNVRPVPGAVLEQVQGAPSLDQSTYGCTLGTGSSRDVPLQERQRLNTQWNSKKCYPGLTTGEKSIPKLFWFLSNPLTHSLPNHTLKMYQGMFFPLILMKALNCSFGVWGLWDDEKHPGVIRSGLRIWGCLVELALSLLHHWKQLLTMCLRCTKPPKGVFCQT